MKTNPQIDPQQEIGVATLTEKEHEIILYNDDFNTFDHVIQTLISVCDHTPVQAEQCTLIVHYKGKCSVKSGTLIDLKPRLKKMVDAKLSAEII